MSQARSVSQPLSHVTVKSGPRSCHPLRGQSLKSQKSGAPQAPGKARARSRRVDPRLITGGILVAFFVLLAIFAGPLSALTGNDPYTPHRELLDDNSVPTGFGGGISAQHWFGVTPLRGADLFSIVAYGAQVSLTIGIGATAISMLIGVGVGLLAGYFPGVVDAVLSRTMDVFFGFPFLIFAIALSAVVPASFPRELLLILVLGFFGWPTIARLIRGQVLSLRGRDYTTAARLMGASTGHILVNELLPGLLPLIIVRLTLALPGRISAEAALSFLGVGINPPTPSWGRSISDAVAWVMVDPMYLLFPGLALFLVTLGFNLLGDGLADALNPRARRRQMVEMIDRTPGKATNGTVGTVTDGHEATERHDTTDGHDTRKEVRA